MAKILILHLALAVSCMGATTCYAQSGFSDGAFDLQGATVGGYCYFSAGTCPAGGWSGSHGVGFVETNNIDWGGLAANTPRHYAFIQLAGQLTQTLLAAQSGAFRFAWFDADRPILGGGRHIS